MQVAFYAGETLEVTFYCWGFFHNVSNEKTEVYDYSSVFLFLCVYSLY